jgi:hypothetical protein
VRGAGFINICWNLGEPETLQREVGAMALGRMWWPRARGFLVYHEYFVGVDQAVPEAVPAWKFLIGDGP